MSILLHVILALSSLGASAYSYVLPSSTKLRNSRILIISTLLSGTYLVFANQVNILRTCLTGLTFLAVTTFVTHLARQKLNRNLQSSTITAGNK